MIETSNDTNKSDGNSSSSINSGKGSAVVVPVALRAVSNTTLTGTTRRDPVRKATGEGID